MTKDSVNRNKKKDVKRNGFNQILIFCNKEYETGKKKKKKKIGRANV